MKTTKEAIVETLLAEMEKIENGDSDIFYFALRSMSPRPCGEKVVAEVGETLECSFVWDDSSATDEELDGTCCIAITNLDSMFGVSEASIRKAVDRALVDLSYYPGSHNVLVGGKSIEDGNDDNEWIIEDAKVFLVLK